MKNLNLLYNKIYYNSLPSLTEVTEHNKTLLAASFNQNTDYRKPFDGVQTFRLETVYPGMILGSGNPHGAHASENDLQMGFSFDYVTGQPYIPGSSVKGVLRSCFERSPEVIEELTECEDAKALTRELFEGDDVFLDAVLYRGTPTGKLMGEDYITPHPDPVKNPLPIHIIKLLPEVQLEFRFLLKDSQSITAAAKLALYQRLLEIFGIGAKTNVGYGGLVACDRAAAEVTQITCRCGVKNYKYWVKDGKVTTQINEKWKLKKCRGCGGTFR